MSRRVDRLRWAALGAALLACWSPAPAAAWLSEGHRGIAEAAVALQPEEVPAFFRSGGKAVGYHALDPDARKNPQALALTSREGPEHYIDLERFGDLGEVDQRSEILAWALQGDVEVANLGFAPWAVVEWTEQLTLAFAEVRRWPDDEVIRAKVLYVAGNLAHYAADLGQPLHTSIHHDGRALPDGSSPLIGMHRVVDGWAETLALDWEGQIAGLEPQPIEALWPAVLDWVQQNHRLVDRVYELYEGDCPEKVEAFTRQQLRASSLFLARLYLTAWQSSEEIRLPVWLLREAPRPEE